MKKELIDWLITMDLKVEKYVNKVFGKYLYKYGGVKC